MKKILLIFSLAAVCLTGCDLVEFESKTPKPVTPSKDAELAGAAVDAAAIPADVRKVFLLNEGGMGSNNASLDFLRVSDGTYVTGAFKKMNPSAGAGLGDVGNDVAVIGDEVWIVVNNSGIVEVLSAEDETEIAAIQVPTPRSIAFDEKYAYVSSWSGAYASGSYDENWNYVVTDYANPRGVVFRINRTTKKLDGIPVRVGYQPEGLAISGDKLYVANSGGIASQLPPDYAYDNTVTVIDTKTFSVSKTLPVQVNLKNVYADGAGNVYVTCLGDYWMTHSGLYRIDAAGAVSHIADYVSASAVKDGVVYWVGTEDEFDWSGAPKTWKAFSYKDGTVTALSLPVSATALYGLCALDGQTFLVSDAGDYFNPGTVSLYGAGVKKWSVTAGVCPGHFAIW